jgi:hypothetical protein
VLSSIFQLSIPLQNFPLASEIQNHFLNADCASILLGRGARGNHKKPERESRTLNMASTVAHALRNLSWALARLGDTLDEASSNSLEP